MENASKALVMAGSILLSLLVIGSLVFLYRDLSSIEVAKEESKKNMQITEYNKPYLAYEKELYGSELLSLINKVLDYDNKIDKEQSGYTKMSISLKVSRNYGSFITINTYKIDNGNNIFKNKLDSIESIKTTYKGDKFLERLSAALGSNNETEFQKVLKDEVKITINSANLEKAKKDVALYSDYIDFKRMKFTHLETTYDINGRIQQMSYEEKIN